MTNTLQHLRQAEPCDIEIASPWSKDHDIWRLWVTLHFLPLNVMQSGKLRKNDLKKIASLLREHDLDQLESFIFLMLKTELLTQQSSMIAPQSICWPNWQKTVRSGLLKSIKAWQSWSDDDETQVLKLLTTLPTNSWLKLDEVVEWLQEKASGKVLGADWMALFTQNHSLALHHLNMSRRSIYLLPYFQDVLNQTPLSFPAPGWYGADSKASIKGFISTSGEIQLMPDCNHRLLHQLKSFCNITSIEQIITLQLDNSAIQRMATDKAGLSAARNILESIQSSLPQSIIYLFDKINAQQAIAAVAATSMVIVLNDLSAIHKLQKMDVEFSQPFQERPEIVLLDASADAHAFVRNCHQSGIQLDKLIPPVQWITGTASLNAWMQVNLDREDQWLEIVYQKSLSSAPKQIFARIDADFYGSIRIQPTRKTKGSYNLLKTTLELQPKHLLRLRELDDDEVIKLGLDRQS